MTDPVDQPPPADGAQPPLGGSAAGDDSDPRVSETGAASVLPPITLHRAA